jgi:glycosyltransferase involved in cell wall biosynthesis
MHLITCNAAYGVGGLGNLLADAVERARGEGEAFCYVSGGAKAGDELIATAIGSRSSSALNRIPPIRFHPGWRQYLTFELFDRAAARRIDRRYGVVLAFAGQAMHTFRRARALGCERLELLSPTAHVNHVWRQHRRAYAQYPIERDWLSAAHRDKVLAEYELADAIHVLSDHAWQTFVEEGVAPSRLRAVAPRVDERFHADASIRADDGVFRIVYTGALSVVKGVPLLIDAFRRLLLRDAQLTLVGASGTRGMRRYLERAVRNDPRIRIAPGDPLPHLRRADVYVHPSYQDGFAYALAEAMACGVPVIVSEGTGAKERVVQGVNGWIVPTGDVDAIHARLEQLIASKTRSKVPACAS